MNSEQDLLREIAALDDDALRDGIGRVAKSMGFDPSLAAAYLGDMGKIRETVLGLTPEDLQKIRESVGEDNMNQIITGIRQGLEDV